MLYLSCAIVTTNWDSFWIVSQIAMNCDRFSKDIVFFWLFGARFELSGSYFDENYFSFTNLSEYNILPYIVWITFGCYC